MLNDGSQIRTLMIAMVMPSACTRRQSIEAGASFSTNVGPTERKVAIVEAAMRLAVWDPDPEAARVVVGIVLETEIQPAVTVGAALGSLTIAEAKRLHQIATDLTTGAAVINFAQTPPSLTAA